jgi:hypothetical protein
MLYLTDCGGRLTASRTESAEILLAEQGASGHIHRFKIQCLSRPTHQTLDES